MRLGGSITLAQSGTSARSEITRSRTSDNPVGSRDELGEIGNALLEPLFPVARSIRLLGISLSSLGAEEVKPETQFDLSV
jgi:DNA polymerase-4